MRGFQRWFLSYTFPSCLPDPRHLAVPARPVVVGAACHPPRRLPDQAAPSFTGCCDSPAAKVSHLRSVQQRLVALDVRDPQHVRRRSGLNCRSTRSSATLTPGTRIVVLPFLTFTSPEIPAWRMNLRIRLRETRMSWPTAARPAPGGTVDASCLLVDLGDPRGQPRVSELPVARGARSQPWNPDGTPRISHITETGKLALSAEMIR